LPRTLTEASLEAFRDRLIDAAERLFAERGLDAVTMRELAAAIGVSPMTPYRYFPDKDAILAAVRARAFRRHAEALEAAFDDGGPDPEAAASAVGRAYVAFALAHPEAYKLMFDVRQPSEEAYPELVAAAARSRATMTRHLEPLAAAGLLKGDTVFIGHMFWAALHGPIMLALSGMLGKEVGLRRLAEVLMKTLSRGLEKAGQSTM
jgi:AcrR family transcriptional regulator